MQTNTKKEIKFWAITITILALVAFVIIGLVSVSGGGQITLGQEEWSKGKLDSPAVLVEYSDLQCPACRGFWQYAREVLEPAYGDKIRLVYRHFPLTAIHPQAQLAAQAAEAAGVQGKFWEMHDKLFAEQINWSGTSNAAELFAQYAGELGLDTAKFKTDMMSDAVRQAVAEDLASGTQANVPGTPTFFLNGQMIKIKQSYDELRGLLDQALEGQ